MKILIIGASGMLAKPVVKELDKRGYQLRLFSRSVQQSMFPKDYEIVNGDVYSIEDLKNAMAGCNAVHVSLTVDDEAGAMQCIVDAGRESGIELISTISGCTVAEENRWFHMVDDKFRAEQILIQSGINYMIFRATWFFESLGLLVRNGKAMMIGRQNHPYHWIAAADYARMVGEAFDRPAAANRIFYALGETPLLMKDLLVKYCEIQHPEIKKISTTPTGMLKMIATLSGKKPLKKVAEMFAYFEKTPEMGDPAETYAMLGKPQLSFQDWLYEID